MRFQGGFEPRPAGGIALGMSADELDIAMPAHLRVQLR
jgi:hypothetical protein